MAVGDVLLDAARDEPQRAYRMITEWALSNPAQWRSNVVPGQCMSSNTFRLMQLQHPEQLHTDLSACKHYTAGLSDATLIKQATLLLLGSADKMTPIKASLPLQAALPHAKLTVLPGCGHSLMSEQPELVRSALVAFLS
jgi:pimeloyl-ACP methyl ester carboxylesterase